MVTLWKHIKLLWSFHCIMILIEVWLSSKSTSNLVIAPCLCVPASFLDEKSLAGLLTTGVGTCLNTQRIPPNKTRHSESLACSRNMGVSKNNEWYPQIIHFNRVFHYKPSIFGYPYFWKHPYEFHSSNLGGVFRYRYFFHHYLNPLRRWKKHFQQPPELGWVCFSTVFPVVCRWNGGNFALPKFNIAPEKLPSQ